MFELGISTKRDSFSFVRVSKLFMKFSEIYLFLADSIIQASDIRKENIITRFRQNHIEVCFIPVFPPLAFEKGKNHD